MYQQSDLNEDVQEKMMSKEEIAQNPEKAQKMMEDFLRDKLILEQVISEAIWGTWFFDDVPERYENALKRMKSNYEEGKVPRAEPHGFAEPLEEAEV